MQQVCELLNQGRVSTPSSSYIAIIISLSVTHYTKSLHLHSHTQLLELFGTGTACVVSPINRIHYMDTDLYIPTMEQEKPIHEWIRETLSSIQYGKIEHPWAVLID